MDKSTVVHGTSRQKEWGTPGRKSLEAKAARDDPAAPMRRGSRKNTRDWCKGKAGREHQMRVQVPPSRAGAVCRWGPAYEFGRVSLEQASVRWECCHVRLCIICGKEAFPSVPRQECPDYPGDQAQKQEAMQAVERWRARNLARPSPWAAAHARRKQARLSQLGISGYRKKK
jgi:hypothetical protein